MEVELHKSYFTLHCNLETEGRAWAFLNEFICIGKNKNDHYVCLTSTLPIEIEVTDGGATLTITREEELFDGRRPAAQSLLQYTVRNWKSQTVIQLKREKTGCLLLPNLYLKELKNDRNNLIELVKRALPEVRAEWQTEKLIEHLQKPLSDNSITWLDQFPKDWIFSFDGIISISYASLKSNEYKKDSVNFDLKISNCFDNPSENYIEKVDLSMIEDICTASDALDLRVELEINFSKLSAIFRIKFKNNGEENVKEATLDIESDHLDKANPKLEQLISTDRLALKQKNVEEQNFELVNLLIMPEEFSDELANKFDRQAGISVRLAPFLSRR